MPEADPKALIRDLQDMNSQMPATRQFLAARGLKNVRELDEQGRKELVEYLERTLRLATN